MLYVKGSGVTNEDSLVGYNSGYKFVRSPAGSALHFS